MVHHTTLAAAALLSLASLLPRLTEPATQFPFPLNTPHSTLSTPSQPNLVQPESLPQGFILVVADKLGVATSDSPVFIASNHNGWNPADQNQKLTPRSDRRWQIVFPKPKLDSRLAFKFTRGSWDNVETDAKFADVENRSLPKIDAATIKPNEPPIIELTIEGFKDKRPAALTDNSSDPYREIKVAGGSIRRVEVTGGGTPLTRDVIIWLPPGYDDPNNAERTYPILYLNDGQNIFEKPSTAPGEWQADETAIRLIAAKELEPLIIVGIPHAGAARAIEYLPTPALENTPARGEQYTDFLVNQVIPRVERSLRVRSGTANRAIGGSSLGAIISLYAASQHPDLFGGVLAESPSLNIRGESLMPLFESVKKWPAKIYIGVGTRELENQPATAEANQQYVEAARNLESHINSNATGSFTVRLVVEKDATHTESAWANRLPDALKFLFPPGK